MITWLQQLMGGPEPNRKFSLAASAEHIELTNTHLVLGLKVDWLNQTEVPISIKEFQASVYTRGLKEEPLRFYPLERFERVFNQRGIQKKPIRPFSLPSGKIFTEHFRFISQEVRDIAPGNYTMDILSKDTDDASYTNRVKILLEAKMKYRRSEEWEQG